MALSIDTTPPQARMSTGENWNCIMHATMVIKQCMLLTVPDLPVVAAALYAGDLNRAALWADGLPGGRVSRHPRLAPSRIRP